MVKKLIHYYNQLEEILLIISLVVTVGLIFTQIFMRYVLNDSLTWSEELARYIFIWQIWLGTSIGFRYEKHIRITVILDVFKEKGRAVYDIIARLILVAFCGFLAVYGMKMVGQLNATHYLSAALRMPLSIVYFALPFSSFIVCLRNLAQIVNNIKIIIGKAVPRQTGDEIGGSI